MCEQANFDANLAHADELMYIAGKGCAEIFLSFCRQFSAFKRLVIFAGHGNNGGDGVVMANILAGELSQKVILALSSVPEKFSECSKEFFSRLAPEVAVVPAGTIELDKHDLVIDALLGTGCTAPMREPYKSLISKINQSHCKVFSVDLPSGLGSDVCVKADMTAVIGCFKDQLFTEQGIEHSGLLRLTELPLPIKPENPSGKTAFYAQRFQQTVHAQPRNIHKYQRGSVLIAGGSREYFQAPFLTARAALRSGCGLVRLAVPFAIRPGSGCLGVIPTEIANDNGYLCGKSFEDILPFLSKTNCIATGPGMGRTPCTGEFVVRLLKTNIPLVLDADALYHASQLEKLFQTRQAPVVLTPHTGEAKILAGNSGLSSDNAENAVMLAKKYHAVVLLKGPRTVIAEPSGKVILNTSGTPALATAGSGDTLTGIIASEIACKNPAASLEQTFLAAARGAFLHGLAGEYAAARYGLHGVIADDLPECTAYAAAALENNQDIF